MKISVITPTADRLRFLQGTYRLLKQQKYSNWEWLIYDTSCKPTHFSDSRVIYLFDEGVVSIGEKRNRLIERATGDAIVHFDDDDYYAPTYLENVVSYLKKAFFVKLHGWFSYDLKTRQIYYWATDELGESRYVVNAVTGATLREIDFGPYLEGQKEKLNYKGKTGYGFSYAYAKEVADVCSFPDIDVAEDRKFFEAVQEAGFAIDLIADKKGEAVHVIHELNTSGEFPQYRIPRFLVKNLFPDFFSYIEPFHEN